MNHRRVVLSGIGTVTPFGVGVGPYWEGISHGRSAAAPITRFDASLLPTRFAAQLAVTDEELETFIDTPKILKTLSRAGKFIMIAAREAIDDAHFDYEKTDPYRFGTCIGAAGLGLLDLEHTNQTMDIVADTLGHNGKLKLHRGEVWKNSLESIHPLTPLQGLSNIPTAQISIRYNARGNSLTITTACTSSI